jgi:hypothetical protein
MIRLDTAAADQNSRLVLVVLNAATMRQMEVWRDAMASAIGRTPDPEDVMIVGAIQSIGGEKLLREVLREDLRSPCASLPHERLTVCNVASIAATTNINRETVRRRTNRMVKEGLLTRTDGSLRVAETVMQLPLAQEAVRKQLASFQMTYTRLHRLGVIV